MRFLRSSHRLYCTVPIVVVVIQYCNDITKRDVSLVALGGSIFWKLLQLHTVFEPLLCAIINAEPLRFAMQVFADSQTNVYLSSKNKPPEENDCYSNISPTLFVHAGGVVVDLCLFITTIEIPSALKYLRDNNPLLSSGSPYLPGWQIFCIMIHDVQMTPSITSRCQVLNVIRTTILRLCINILGCFISD